MKVGGHLRGRRVGAGLVCGLALAATLTVAAVRAPTSRPAATTQPAATTLPACGHRPVSLDLIIEYLKRWDVADIAPDPDGSLVRFQLLVNRRTRLNCLIQVKTKRDGQTFDRLYIAFLDLAHVPARHPRLAEVLRTLASLNWQNAIGKYSWDETDGEIRLEYALLANDGLCYADFEDVLNRLTLTADHDLPTLQRLIWR